MRPSRRAPGRQPRGTRAVRIGRWRSRRTTYYRQDKHPRSTARGAVRRRMVQTRTTPAAPAASPTSPTRPAGSAE
ncbi:hypothetical protein ACFSM7_05650 [Clavibacter michiganensis subsp. tessellarius]|uniref:hypothetical protein n=1 Tax=Clavibacter tessellarius TaxID=31965 RepID=UPI003628E441